MNFSGWERVIEKIRADGKKASINRPRRREKEQKENISRSFRDHSLGFYYSGVSVPSKYWESFGNLKDRAEALRDKVEERRVKRKRLPYLSIILSTGKQ